MTKTRAVFAVPVAFAFAIVFAFAFAAAPALAQPAANQVACWTTAGVSTYDLVGMPQVEGGTLNYRSQEGLSIRQSGACMARQSGVLPLASGKNNPVAQCYDQNGVLIYSAEIHYPYPTDGALVWIEVETGDFIIALSSLRCDIFVFD